MKDLRVPIALMEGLPFKKVRKLYEVMGETYNPDLCWFKLCEGVSWSGAMRSLGKIRAHMYIILARSDELRTVTYDGTMLHAEFNTVGFSFIDIDINNECLRQAGFDIDHVNGMSTDSELTLDTVYNILVYTLYYMGYIMPKMCQEWGIPVEVGKFFLTMLDADVARDFETTMSVAYQYYYSKQGKPFGMSIGSRLFEINSSVAEDLMLGFEHSSSKQFTNALEKAAGKFKVAYPAFVNAVEFVKTDGDFVENEVPFGVATEVAVVNKGVSVDVTNTVMDDNAEHRNESSAEMQEAFVLSMLDKDNCMIIDCENVTTMEILTTIFAVYKAKTQKTVSEIVFVYDSKNNQDIDGVMAVLQEYITAGTLMKNIKIVAVPVTFMKATKIYSLTDMAIATYAGNWAAQHSNGYISFVTSDSDIAGIVQTLKIASPQVSIGVFYDLGCTGTFYRSWCQLNGVCCFEISGLYNEEPFTSRGTSLKCSTVKQYIAEFKDKMFGWLYNNEYKSYIEERIKQIMLKHRHSGGSSEVYSLDIAEEME